MEVNSPQLIALIKNNKVTIVNHPQAEDLWACHEQLSP